MLLFFCMLFHFLFACLIHRCAGGLSGFSVHTLPPHVFCYFQLGFTWTCLDNSTLNPTDITYLYVTQTFHIPLLQHIFQCCRCVTPVMHKISPPYFYSGFVKWFWNFWWTTINNKNGRHIQQEFSVIAHRSDILHNYSRKIEMLRRSGLIFIKLRFLFK